MNNFNFRSLILCTSFFFLAGSLQSQQSLTQINGWNAYVHLPANYNSTTITYPTIIFFPGIGEIGTNPSAVIAYGPGAYITQGWNGNIVVNGNTVEFIVISLQPPTAWPNEIAIDQKIQTIKSLYRVNPTKLYLTGLSMGGWCGTTYVTGDPYGGPYTYASQIAAVIEVEGVKPDDNAPYSNLFDNFANSGGKLLGFEQINDNRDISTRVNRMNTTRPNSGIYIQTNFGGGGHCCWSQFYGGQGLQPGIFSLGGINQNLYQWIARQSLGGTLPASLISFAGYKEGYSNKLRWTTASEINTSGFEVQRSADGINYAPIGFVNSQAIGGTSTAQLNYTFADNNVTGNRQYYRLRQVDFDNQSKLSNIVWIKGDKPASLMIEGLYPNPAKTIVNVMIAAPNKEKITLVVTDISGRTMFQQPVSIEPGNNMIPVDISRLNNGIYMTQLICGSNGTRSIYCGSHVFSVKQ